MKCEVQNHAHLQEKREFASLPLDLTAQSCKNRPSASPHGDHKPLQAIAQGHIRTCPKYTPPQIIPQLRGFWNFLLSLWKAQFLITLEKNLGDSWSTAVQISAPWQLQPHPVSVLFLYAPYSALPVSLVLGQQAKCTGVMSLFPVVYYMCVCVSVKSRKPFSFSVNGVWRQE